MHMGSPSNPGVALACCLGERFLSMFSLQSQAADGMPCCSAGYPASLLQRLPLPEAVILAVVAAVRSNDVYNQVCFMLYCRRKCAFFMYISPLMNGEAMCSKYSLRLWQLLYNSSAVNHTHQTAPMLHGLSTRCFKEARNVCHHYIQTLKLPFSAKRSGPGPVLPMLLLAGVFFSYVMSAAVWVMLPL